MHVYTSYPLGLAEAHARWYWYPPPYWYNNTWYYATPWLWIDGNKDGAYIYNQWSSMITNRMNQPSPVTITMWGDWWPAAGTGTLYAQFRNDSSAALTGNVLFVVTEDSVYSPSGNGDLWHNQVSRDYIPNHIGTSVSIPAGDSATVSETFTLGPTWNPEKIKFVTFIQDQNMTPDSIIEIWQGQVLDINDLGIEEYGNNQVYASQIAPTPNPCVNNTRFTFTLPAGEEYKISLYDVSGRKIQTIDGVASGDDETVNWDLTNEQGARVSAGVYLYRFESTEINATGKVVVR